jgi:digeranylgeranylglycerophospholipid reductase
MRLRNAMNESCDVVVVGAGPSGSTAARFAAEGGCGVLLIERKRDIGIPVRCAEGASQKSLREFLEPDPAFIRNEISKVRLFAPDGNAVVITPENSGYILDRRVFDRELANIAASKGVEVLTSCTATGIGKRDDKTVTLIMKIRNEEYKVNCRIVIGADGVESRVGRWFGLKTVTTLHNTEGALQYVINHPGIEKDYCDFYFGSEVAPGGYLWVFPGNDHNASVGLGCAGDRLKGKSLHHFLDSFIERNYTGARILSEVAGGIPVQATLKEIIADNLMLVGDAARQVNPMTGAGIVNGMIAGKIAGTVAAEAVKKGSWAKKDFRDYPVLWHERIGRNHERFFKMKEVINDLSDRSLNKIAEAVNSLPEAKRTMRKLFMTALIKHPALLGSLKHLF